LVVCNLKPRNMKGIDSNGMVLAASDKDKTKVQLVQAPDGCKPGERVTYDGITGEPAVPNVVNKKKILETVLPGLKTDATCKVIWREETAGKVYTVQTTLGACLGGNLADGNVA